MSSESETEEFFDAEEAATPIRKKSDGAAQVQSVQVASGEGAEQTPASLPEETKPTEDAWPTITETLAPRMSDEQLKEAEKKAKESERRRKRVEELRWRVLRDDEYDDDASDLLSEESSVTSSMDGIYLPGVSLKVTQIKAVPESSAEDDTSGTISLGKIGTILSEDTDQLNGTKRDASLGSLSQISSRSSDSLNRGREEEGPHPAPEPDVVASTKGADRPPDLPQPPVPPPRRRKKANIPSSLSGDSVSIDEECIPAPQGLPSPTSTVESFVRELEHSLDLNSAVRGQYVVKPQDMEQDRGDNLSIPGSSPLPSSGHTPESTPKEGSLSSQTASRDTTGRDKSDSTPEGSLRQLNMLMRTRSDSGRQLTDLEILEQVTVVNLDTGEQIPLSVAEERLPKCINPLSLHIMRLTSEYVSNSGQEKESDEESVDSKSTSSRDTFDRRAVRKARRIGNLIGRSVQKTVTKIKNVADEVYHQRHPEDVESSEEEVLSPDARPTLKVKVSKSHKRPYDFDCIKQVQEIGGEYAGAIWTMKFSSCGRLLATAGHVLRIWVLRDAYGFFDDMRQKYNTEAKVSPAPSQESISSHQSADDTTKMFDAMTPEDAKGPFMSKPFCTYEGHTADLLDVSWSKNYFILSSSMDKTVRLWHISRRECLCCFQHIDFVTAIAFHPRDDRYFLSGSLDGKLRLWNIPDKKVALWNELEGPSKLITAANFCQNGRFAVVGSYDGRCVFYHTEQLKYYTQIHVRSTRGKNRQGRKISGIEPMPGEDKILVTSNDSRIRLYDLRDLSLSCKYKGAVNPSSQIKGSFSHDGKYIISGSENQFFYIWKVYHDYSKFSSARRDKNDYWEGIKAHNAVVTAAVFAPNPGLILRQLVADGVGATNETGGTSGYVIVSADFNGVIKVFVNKIKSKSATTHSGTSATTPSSATAT